jgi:hypothetical protein
VRAQGHARGVGSGPILAQPPPDAVEVVALGQLLGQRVVVEIALELVEQAVQLLVAEIEAMVVCKSPCLI